MQMAEKMEKMLGFGAQEGKIMDESFYVIYVLVHSKYDGTLEQFWLTTHYIYRGKSIGVLLRC